MLKMIDTLSDNLKKRKIFVWGVKRNSMAVFARLAFRGIRIAGFVSTEERYVGEIFFNSPVVEEKDLFNDSEVLVVADHHVYVKENLPDGLDVYYIDELMTINPDLYKKNVIIYGAGQDAEDIFQYLKKGGVEIKAFCVTEKDKQEFLGLPLYALDEIKLDDRNAFVISGKNELYRYEKQYNLEQKNTSEIYIDEFIPWLDIAMSTFVQSLHNAIQEKRKIFIYTKTIDDNAKMIANTLRLYQAEVSGYLYQETCIEENIKDVFEITCEDVSEIFVVINETYKPRIQDACEILEALGCSLATFGYTALRIPFYEYKNPPKRVPDSLLGYSDLGEFSGFHVYGHQKPDDTKILVLGGSTSNDGTMRGICWPKILYRKLYEAGYHVSIYNGAHCGQGVVHELFRLIRDGWIFNPDYVVSMSGVNDSTDPYPETGNRFRLGHLIDKEKELGLETEYGHGNRSEEDNFDFWLRIERVMKSVVESCGAKFLCYLQPMKFGKQNMSLLEESVHNDEKREAFSFREKASSDDFYTNLIGIFDEAEGMYIDACHYSDRANQILADIVFREIRASLPEVL